MNETPPPRPIWEVFTAFLMQGLTAFGGPVAHIGYFRREFVERRGWLSEAAFADLLALSQFLPGPASSQLGMAIGQRRAGYGGMLAAWLGFTLPAAVAMIALAYIAPALPAVWSDGVLHGLKLAAAAVVLQALVIMARQLAFGPIRAGMAIGAGLGLVLAHGPVAQIMTLAAGGPLRHGLSARAPQSDRRADARRSSRHRIDDHPNHGARGLRPAARRAAVPGGPCRRTRTWALPASSTAPARWCSAAATWSCRSCRTRWWPAAGSIRTTSWPATA